MSVHVKLRFVFIVALVLLLAAAFASRYAVHPSLDHAAWAWHPQEVSNGVKALLADLPTVGWRNLRTVLAFLIVVFSALSIRHHRRHRKKAETALREMQQGLEGRVRERTGELSNMVARYRLLFENTPAPMVIFDVETLDFLDLNRAAEKLYGYTCEEFLAMNVRDNQFTEDDPMLMEVLKTIQFTDSYATRFVTQRKNGELLSVEARVRTIDFGERRVQLALLTDITEQKHIEAQLRQSQKMEAIEQLAGRVVHDLNNLLTIILGYSDLILRRLEENHPLRTKVSEIQAAGERAANLTRQLVAFSRNQMLNPQVLNLNAVVTNIFQMLQRLLGEDVEIILQLSPDLGQVRADPTQLEHALLNLAVNARDAMPHGGKLTIETDNVDFDHDSANLHRVPPGRYVMLIVSDTGCGMDVATKNKIFEPFFTTKDVGKGTGLGLSIVFTVVQQSGGTVTVYSELGVGSKFKICLPRVDTPGKGERVKQQKSLAVAATSTILLAEDEESIRLWAAEVLRDAGCRVLEASNGREALEVANETPQMPAVLLTDVVMPGIGGPELAQILLRKCPSLSVIYASGYTKDALLRRRVLTETMPFLQKPYTAEALLEQIARVQIAEAASPTR